jgi:uncharacterized membrane protein HdeD (DUF308 family)
LISLISYYVAKQEKRPEILLFAGIGSILFGVILVSIPHLFVNVLMYLFGLLLLLGGAEQIITLVRAGKRTTVHLAFYIIPSVIVIAGIFVLFNPFKTAETIFILIGISCLVYGIMEFVNGLKFKRRFEELNVVEEK